MASSTPIKKLSTELIIKVFESLNSLTDLIHLAQSSKDFRAIWEVHGESICDLVLPRRNPYYSEARAIANQFLARVPQRRKFSASVTNKARFTISLARTPGSRLKLYEARGGETRPRWFLQINDSGTLSTDFLVSKPFGQRFVHHERKRFMQLYYQLWTLSILPRASAMVLLGSMRYYPRSCLGGLGSAMMSEAWGLPSTSTEDARADNEVFWNWLFAHFYKELADLYDKAFLRSKASVAVPVLRREVGLGANHWSFGNSMDDSGERWQDQLLR